MSENEWIEGLAGDSATCVTSGELLSLLQVLIGGQNKNALGDRYPVVGEGFTEDMAIVSEQGIHLGDAITAQSHCPHIVPC